MKNTNLIRRGTSSPFGCSTVQEKITKTLIANHSVNNPDYFHMTPENVKILQTKELFEGLMKTMSVNQIAKELGTTPKTIYRWHKQHELNMLPVSSSSQETEIAVWLTENNINFIHPTKNIISPYELDFYFPDHNLAIEIQGDYWHMNPNKYKSTDTIRNGKTAEIIWASDKNKSNLCITKGINLITIWESDWEDNKDELKETLLKLLS